MLPSSGGHGGHGGHDGHGGHGGGHDGHDGHGSGHGSMPSVPSDPDLRVVIDKLAQFVSRNGPEFEEMTKRKQKNNPKFHFLFGGEHYQYYMYKVNAEQTRFGGGGNSGGNNDHMMEQQQQDQHHQQQQQQQRPRFGRWDNQGPQQQGPQQPSQQQQSPWGASPKQLPSLMGLPQQQHPALQELKDKLKEKRQQQQTLRDQIAQSEENLSAQLAVTQATQATAAEDAVKKAKFERLQMLAAGTGIEFEELEVVVNPIVESCTKDSIGGGKSWIFQKATTHDNNQLIAHYLAYRVTAEDAPFQTRLHLIYLMNDVLHHCVRKNADELKHSLESVAVEMFAATSLAAKADQQPKLTKLIKLWENKQIFSSSTLNKMRNSKESWNKYKSRLKEDYADMIKAATTQSQATYDNYAGQHNNFVSHANSSIQSMEQEKIRLEEQIQEAEDSAPMSEQQEQQQQQGGQIAPKVPPPTQEATPPAVTPKRGGRSSRWDTGASADKVALPPPGQWQAPTDSPGVAWQQPQQAQQQQQQPWQGEQGQQQQQQDPNSPWAAPQQPQQQQQSVGPWAGSQEGQQPGGSSAEASAGPWAQQQQQPQQGQQPPPGGNFALPDLSRPPPGFALPPVDESSLTPTLPYYDLPAGLMVPLIKLEDSGYKPLDPKELKLPPPTPPTERLLQALEMFYAGPSHDHPRDAEGWEMTGLYEWGKAKTMAVKKRIEDLEAGTGERSRTASPEPFSSRESTPEREEAKKARRSASKSPKREVKKKRYRSRSRTRSRSKGSTPDRSKRSRSRSRSRSHSPYHMPSYLTRRSPSPPSGGARRAPQQQQQRARSPSPPPARAGFGNTVPGPSSNERLSSSNKGHQMMQKMGWKGSGLGSSESGIVDPISGGEIRDRKDQYKGVGVGSDPFEAFRKAKSGSFNHMMRKRGPESLNRK